MHNSLEVRVPLLDREVIEVASKIDWRDCLHIGQKIGKLPCVSYESGVDVDDFGVVFKDNSINTIQNTVQMVSNFPAEQLQQMARKAWEFARANHTREKFAEEYKKTFLSIMGKAESCEPGKSRTPNFPNDSTLQSPSENDGNLNIESLDSFGGPRRKK
jgi:hypothetical protein